MDELKVKAINLKNCIDEATRGIDELNVEKVSEIAAMCTLTLGY